MAMTVNTNLQAMSSLGHLNKTNRGLEGTFTRISSGLRINKAADDAANMAVTENLDADARSLKVALNNTSDGVSVIQVAEGATAEIGNIIKRMRELAVQSASETLADDERFFIEEEFIQLADEVDRIAVTTNFNGVNLTDGTTTELQVQVGIHNSSVDRIAINLGDMQTAALGLDTLTLLDSDSAFAAIDDMDLALQEVNRLRSGYGSVQNRLESSTANLESYLLNLNAAKSRIKDADFATEAADMAKYQIMQQAGIAVLGQANQINSGATQLIG